MELDSQSPEIIEYKAITGTFGEVRYFITTLDHSDAVENIVFADTLQKSWTFSERVQRKLDEERAKTEIFRYLAKSGIRFFNSLVVVLLPNSEDQQEFWDYEQVSSQGKKLEKWVNLKVYKNVSRVVIDGQHRLLALKKYWDIHLNPDHLLGAEKLESYDCSIPFDIPVVYIVFSDLGKIGGLVDEPSDSIRSQIIKATRNIFTVINKTAKPIDRQTQLLLDDTKLNALIPRKLLEEEVFADHLIKWSAKTMNLGATDPYLTTLDLISQATAELLRDHKKEALDKPFNSPLDRETALAKFYESHPKLEPLGTKELFRWFFHDLQPFKDWHAELDKVGIVIPVQPDTPELTSVQKEKLKQLRLSSILYTVLGQKILFFSVCRFLLRIAPKYRVPETLVAIAASIGKMHDEGFLDRNKEHWSHVLVQPNEKLSMITKGTGTDRCIDLVRMILLDSSEGVSDLLKKTKDEIGSNVTWSRGSVTDWRKKYHVILPEIADEVILESDSLVPGPILDEEEENSTDESNNDLLESSPESMREEPE
jgi:DGQHR domain-containing protein